MIISSVLLFVIQNHEAKTKREQIELVLKSSSGESCKLFEAHLQQHNIQCQAYHSNCLVGNHVHKMVEVQTDFSVTGYVLYSFNSNKIASQISCWHFLHRLPASSCCVEQHFVSLQMWPHNLSTGQKKFKRSSAHC